MTLLPLIDCSKRLTIDPKTLRSWVAQANMALSPHPSDARVKCLTQEQVSQLAALYGRVLPPLITHPTSLLEPSLPHELAFQAHSDRACQGTSVTLPSISLHDDPAGDTTLSRLEKQVATLQEQLAGLTMILLQERTMHNELRLQRLETLLLPNEPRLQLSPDLPRVHGDLQGGEGSQNERPLHPAELQKRAQVLPPLIEYGATSTYVIICPLQGELAFRLDSPEWFDWLARLSSFRFVGKQGAFTAYRKGTRRKPSRTWSAQRYFHQHNYRSYLGVTDHLTIAVLEHAAVELQSSLQ